MIGNNSVIAIVLARAGSKGLPKKNLREIEGVPLVCYPIRAAKFSSYVDFIYCSTNSFEIASVAKSEGANTSYIRPENLAEDETSSVDVVLDALEYFESVGNYFQYVIMLEPTSPLTESSDIDSALEMLHFNTQNKSSLISVAESISGHPQFTFIIDDTNSVFTLDGKPWKFRRRQDLNKLFYQTGTLYISEVKALKDFKSFISSSTIGFVVPKLKSFEVDDLIDFHILEMLFSKRKILADLSKHG